MLTNFAEFARMQYRLQGVAANYSRQYGRIWAIQDVHRFLRSPFTFRDRQLLCLLVNNFERMSATALRDIQAKARVLG